MLNTEYSGENRNEFLDEVKGLGFSWTEALTADENVEEDENFLYLEVEDEEDISEDLYELGWMLDAKTVGEVNNGERYVLAVEK